MPKIETKEVFISWAVPDCLFIKALLGSLLVCFFPLEQLLGWAWFCFRKDWDSEQTWTRLVLGFGLESTCAHHSFCIRKITSGIHHCISARLPSVERIWVLQDWRQQEAVWLKLTCHTVWVAVGHSVYVASAGGCGAAEPPCCAALLPDHAAALVVEEKQALQQHGRKPPLLLLWSQFPEQYFLWVCMALSFGFPFRFPCWSVGYRDRPVDHRETADLCFMKHC